MGTSHNRSVVKYKLEQDGMVVEYELEPIFTSSDEKSRTIMERIAQIDDEIVETDKQIEIIKEEIAKNTSQTDKIDYVLAACSGILAGLVDVFFVGKFDFQGAKAWSNETVNEFVMQVAKKDGYTGDRLSGAIQYLEDHYKVAHDNSFKGMDISVTPKSHHLDDMGHHASIVGLLFSLLTQFTGKAYFSNSNGDFSSVLADNSRIGNTFEEKISNGVINWFFHLVSDVSGSKKTAGTGMGIPGPIMSMAKEFSSLPVVKESGIPKLLDDMYRRERFDFRSELAYLKEIGRQATPVIINEVIVRSFYFIRRFFRELQGTGDVSLIRWEKVMPFKNPTITRMMVVASGAFLVVDMGDAAIKSGGTWVGFIMRVNFVNGFRFVLAVGDEIHYAMKRAQLGDEYQKKLLEKNALLNLKIDYQQQAVWLIAKDTFKAIENTFILYVNYAEEYSKLDEKIDTKIKIATDMNGGVVIRTTDDNLATIRKMLQR